MATALEAFEAAAEAWAKQVLRATAAERRVATLEAQVGELQAQLKKLEKPKEK